MFLAFKFGIIWNVYLWTYMCYIWNHSAVLKTGPRVSHGFLYVSYPPRIELWTLDENSKKENEKECVKAVLYIVILEYSLYSKLSCCIRFIQAAQQSWNPKFLSSKKKFQKFIANRL